MKANDAGQMRTVEGYAYDANTDRLTSATEYLQFNSQANKAGTKIVRSYAYDARTGNPSMITYKNGTTEVEKYTQEYDTVGFLKNESVWSKYGTVRSVAKEYTYDGIGQLKTGKTTKDGTITLNTYHYDDIGNKTVETKKVGSGPIYTTSNDYNQKGYLTRTVESNTQNSNTTRTDFDYDDCGNVVKEMEYENDVLVNTNTYKYSKANQLIETNGQPVAQTATTTKTDSVYNGDGQRILRDTGLGASNSEEIYIYLGSAILFTVNENGSVLTENVLDPSGRIICSWRDSSGKTNSSDEDYYFYHYDMRGSVSNILSTKKTSGNITLVQTYDYDAFGNAKEGIDQSVFKNDIQFTGAVNDKASGLVYLNARHYNPKTGRFMQKDTYRGQAGNPGSHHTYAYCSNNPVNMVDPTGHCPCSYAKYYGTVYKGEHFYDSLNCPPKPVQKVDRKPMTIVGSGSNRWNIIKHPPHTTKNLPHIHIDDKSNGKKYAQNSDGSPHDGNTNQPSNGIKRELRSKYGWDWDKKKAAYDKKIAQDKARKEAEEKKKAAEEEKKRQQKKIEQLLRKPSIPIPEWRVLPNTGESDGIWSIFK